MSSFICNPVPRTLCNFAARFTAFKQLGGNYYPATMLPGFREALSRGVQAPSDWPASSSTGFGLFSLSAPGKILGVTPDFDRVRIKLKRIRPKKYVFKGVIIGPNPR
jgi:hypothetical protein